MVTLLVVAYIWWSGCLIFNTVVSSIIIESRPKVAADTLSFVRVTKPAAVVSNLAVLTANFKSSIGAGTKVLLAWDLNKTPIWGCFEIVLVPPTSISPTFVVQTS